MILSTIIAASIATQSAPAPESKSSPAPMAEKKMACCEMMAKGQGCCCCNDMATESPTKHGEHQKSHDAEGHAH